MLQCFHQKLQNHCSQHPRKNLKEAFKSHMKLACDYQTWTSKLNRVVQIFCVYMYVTRRAHFPLTI